MVQDGLYLDLIKKTLSFTLWPEPPIPYHRLINKKRPIRKRLFSFMSWLLGTMKLQLVKQRTPSSEERNTGKIWPGYADTMIGAKRLDNLQSCVETVIKDGIKGDFIETGVWRGGACIFMRAILKANNIHDRKVYVADSFEGLPKPNADRYIQDKGDKHHYYDFLAVSQEEVAGNFEKYGLLDDQVVFLKGWFKDTLPKVESQEFAVIRLDGDMYESTMDALTNLYPRLAKGGFCIIDDYALKGCEQAVSDYRAAHGITAPITTVDWTGVFWRKD